MHTVWVQIRPRAHVRGRSQSENTGLGSMAVGVHDSTTKVRALDPEFNGRTAGEQNPHGNLTRRPWSRRSGRSVTPRFLPKGKCMCRPYDK